MTHEQLAAMEWALEVLGCIYSPVNERDIEEVGTRMATLRTIIEQAKRQQTLAAPVPDVSLIDEGKTAAPVQEPVTILPDGSAFGVMSFPLPSDHWLYAPNEYRDGEYEPIDLPKPILTHAMRESVVAAVRYAVRGATMRGQETDFDPDALVQNAVYALCGPYTTPPAAPVQEGRDWSLLEATQESLREHMAEIGRLKAIIDAAGQQEPVAWAVHYKGPIPLFTKTKSEAEAWGGNKIVPLYTTPPAATVQEPVAFNAGVPPLYPEMKDGETISVEYTTPPTEPVQETSGCRHKRYSVDVHEQIGICYDCGAEGRMRFVVGDATSPTAPVQEK